MKRIRPRWPDGFVYLGHGFRWTVRHRQLYDRLVSEGRERSCLSGSWTVHAVGERDEPVGLDAGLLDQHIFLCGTTGCGKTRLLELLALQAIRRGDAVAVIDPKGDGALRRRLSPDIRFAPYDGSSCSYNPVGQYEEPRQIADRVAALLPSRGESEAFRNFAWEIVARVAAAIHEAGEEMTLERIRRYAFEGMPDLALRLLRRRAPSLAAGGLDGYLRSRAAGAIAPVPGVEGLADLLSRPREHYRKLASGLSAILTKLTEGRLRTLLGGKDFTWEEFWKRGGVVLFELASLRGSESARALARIALLDLQHAIARAPVGRRRLCLFADEFSDMALPEFVEILNKARGAGVSIAVATQTFSDLTAVLGSPARAMQVLGNASTIVQFRTQDPADAELFSRVVGREPARRVRRSHAVEPGFFGSGARWVEDFRAVFATHEDVREEDVLPPYILPRLPNMHAFARTGGGLWKIVVPIIREEPAE